MSSRSSRDIASKQRSGTKEPKRDYSLINDELCQRYLEREEQARTSNQDQDFNKTATLESILGDLEKKHPNADKRLFKNLDLTGFLRRLQKHKEKQDKNATKGLGKQIDDLNSLLNNGNCSVDSSNDCSVTNQNSHFSSSSQSRAAHHDTMNLISPQISLEPRMTTSGNHITHTSIQDCDGKKRKIELPRFLKNNPYHNETTMRSDQSTYQLNVNSDVAMPSQGSPNQSTWLNQNDIASQQCTNSTNGAQLSADEVIDELLKSCETTGRYINANGNQRNFDKNNVNELVSDCMVITERVNGGGKLKFDCQDNVGSTNNIKIEVAFEVTEVTSDNKSLFGESNLMREICGLHDTNVVYYDDNIKLQLMIESETHVSNDPTVSIAGVFKKNGNNCDLEKNAKGSFKTSLTNGKRIINLAFKKDTQNLKLNLTTDIESCCIGQISAFKSTVKGEPAVVGWHNVTLDYRYYINGSSYMKLTIECEKNSPSSTASLQPAAHLLQKQHYEPQIPPDVSYQPEPTDSDIFNFSGSNMFGTEGNDRYNYNFTSVIGRGAFGMVHLAECKGELVAIKEIFVDQFNRQLKDTVIGKFKNEVAILQKIKGKHENILQIIRSHGLEETNNKGLLVVTEFIDGKNMQTLCHEKDLQNDAKFIITLGCWRGLAFLQENNIAHRDIKPANILITKEFVPKIADFGLSIIGENSASTRTFGGGTQLYQPPEVVLHLKYNTYQFSDNRKCDVYSMAASLVSLWSKQQYLPTWLRANDPENIADITDAKICADVSCWNDLPEKIQQILQNSLHPRQKMRPLANEIVTLFEKITFEGVPTTCGDAKELMVDAIDDVLSSDSHLVSTKEKMDRVHQSLMNEILKRCQDMHTTPVLIYPHLQMIGWIGLDESAEIGRMMTRREKMNKIFEILKEKKVEVFFALQEIAYDQKQHLFYKAIQETLKEENRDYLIWDPKNRSKRPTIPTCNQSIYQSPNIHVVQPITRSSAATSSLPTVESNAQASASTRSKQEHETMQSAEWQKATYNPQIMYPNSTFSYKSLCMPVLFLKNKDLAHKTSKKYKAFREANNKAVKILRNKKRSEIEQMKKVLPILLEENKQLRADNMQLPILLEENKQLRADNMQLPILLEENKQL